MPTETIAFIVSNTIIAITIAVRLERRLGALSERIARLEAVIDPPDMRATRTPAQDRHKR